jgi:hypothetical protein
MLVRIAESGELKELRYNVLGIDIAYDFIGNNSASKERDDDGHRVMTADDFAWWEERISDDITMHQMISAYSERYGANNVHWVLRSAWDIEFAECAKVAIAALKEQWGELDA